jgi:ketosteroid isomerase-like protein
MLRNLSLALAALGIIATGCAKIPAPQDAAADKTKLEADALSWFDYFAKADSDGISNLYAEDALVMQPGGPAVTGRPAIKTLFGAMSAGVKAAGVSLKQGSVTGSEVNGDLGWISGTYTVQDSTGTTLDSGSYMSVHHRTNGSWLYIRDIWNSDRPAAPAAPAKSASKKK